MGHKAGRSFFDYKREWSERKDRVLTDYLPNYLPKVALQLRKPVLVVDGFAGPGKYGDGNLGSPLLIRDILAAAMQRPDVRAEALFIESDPVLFDELEGRVHDVPWIRVRQGRFTEQVDEIESLASTHSVFLYLDPYTVEGLEWEPLDRLFRKIERGHSVEVLLNFNAESFVRRGLAALKKELPPPTSEDDPDLDVPSGAEAPGLDRLDEIVGGAWWRPILSGEDDYFVKIRGLMAGFSNRLRTRFSQVCAHNIYALANDKKPKYALVFGSRTPVALRLMNDAMAGAREMLAERSDPRGADLFDNRPEEIVPDKSRLKGLVLESAREPRPRIEVMDAVVRAWIGGWRWKEIRAEVEELLRAGSLRSETGKVRINDGIRIWAT